MNTVAEQVASHLLQIKAIKLEPNHPLHGLPGGNLPFIAITERPLSYPEVRTYIRDQFVNLIKTKYPQVELIAGVATGALLKVLCCTGTGVAVRVRAFRCQESRVGKSD